MLKHTKRQVRYYNSQLYNAFVISDVCYPSLCFIPSIFIPLRLTTYVLFCIDPFAPIHLIVLYLQTLTSSPSGLPVGNKWLATPLIRPMEPITLFCSFCYWCDTSATSLVAGLASDCV